MGRRLARATSVEPSRSAPRRGDRAPKATRSGPRHFPFPSQVWLAPMQSTHTTRAVIARVEPASCRRCCACGLAAAVATGAGHRHAARAMACRSARRRRCRSRPRRAPSTSNSLPSIRVRRRSLVGARAHHVRHHDAQGLAARQRAPDDGRGGRQLPHHAGRGTRADARDAREDDRRSELEVKPEQDDGAGPPSPLAGEVPAAIEKVAHAMFPRAAVAASMSTGATDSRHLRGAGILAYGVSAARGSAPPPATCAAS